ncbi:hypothetical protein [Streptomyces sp. NPDC005799]|uniref:hypothetical protein n=1 Tax=Streptomyces sp. NPDC005799 TaxID=3154678 RepID=UPI0033FF82AE
MDIYHIATTEQNIPSVKEFVSYITKLYDLAKDYKSRRSPDRLVAEFLRHKEYSGWKWGLLIGAVDHGFIKYVNESGLRVIEYFADPYYGIPVKVSHFGASTNGVLVTGKPSGTVTNGGDVAGWGGDLITFYAEWRRDSHKQPSGYEYCLERLARKDIQSTYMLDDMIEDADGFNVATKVRAGSTIADEVTSLFLGKLPGYLVRFESFVANRFGTEEHIKEIVRNALLPNRNPVITLGRNYLINEIVRKSAALPENIPREDLDAFCCGFAEVLRRFHEPEPLGKPSIRS